MTTWGQYKAEIRLTMLRDEDASEYSDEMLDVALRFAQNDLCPHTSLAKTVVFDSPDYDMETETVFPVPDDAYYLVLENGLLYFTMSNGQKKVLRPLSMNIETDRAAQGFYQFPDSEITLTSPTGGAALTMHYYAYFPMPVDDNDTLSIPRWSHAAIGYLINHYVLVQKATAEVNIAQYKADPDKGNPENAAMRRQMEWLRCQFELQLKQHRPQERMTHQREYMD